MRIEVVGKEITWDDDKNQKNINKHHLSLLAASYVFADADRIEIYDHTHSLDEDRYITIGKAGKVLFVVFTETKDGIIRLISARKADSKERRIYYGEDKN